MSTLSVRGFALGCAIGGASLAGRALKRDDILCRVVLKDVESFSRVGFRGESLAMLIKNWCA
jgi:hypothetical protein